MNPRLKLFPAPSPQCTRCRAPSYRAVRTRQVAVNGSTRVRMYQLWACTVCDNRWNETAFEPPIAAPDGSTSASA